MNPLLDALKKESVILKTHWDETKTMWDDCVRDRVGRDYIEVFRNTIQLCLKGQYGSTYVYGHGMIELFDLIKDSARTLEHYSGMKTTFDDMGEREHTIRYANNELHKRRYSEEIDEDMMVNYDNYPDNQ